MAACVRRVSSGNTTTQADAPEAHPAARRCAWLSVASPDAPDGFSTFFVSVSYTCMANHLILRYPDGSAQHLQRACRYACGPLRLCSRL